MQCVIEEGTVGFAFLRRELSCRARGGKAAQSTYLTQSAGRQLGVTETGISGVLRRLRQCTTISSADADIFDRLEEAVRGHSRTWTCWLQPLFSAAQRIPPPIKIDTGQPTSSGYRLVNADSRFKLCGTSRCYQLRVFVRLVWPGGVKSLGGEERIRIFR